MNLKEHFEANMLDGDDIEHCGGAMISAKAVLEYTEDLVQQLLESLSNYIDHEEDCIRNHFEAGEPTENGYRQRFKGKWYEARPIDKTPKCDCGLDEALIQSKIKEL